jgi:hypothetical protein
VMAVGSSVTALAMCSVRAQARAATPAGRAPDRPPPC